MGPGTLQLLSSVNDCQVAEMQKAGETLDPTQEESCTAFAAHVMSVQAAIIHTYQLTAFGALSEADPAAAAVLWKRMVDLCEKALTVLQSLKDLYPLCGTPQLYDLALDYRGEANRRYEQNLQDSECAKTPAPEKLFPKTT